VFSSESEVLRESEGLVRIDRTLEPLAKLLEKFLNTKSEVNIRVSTYNVNITVKSRSFPEIRYTLPEIFMLEEDLSIWENALPLLSCRNPIEWKQLDYNFYVPMMAKQDWILS
jgi:hypothetical protein